MSDFIRNQKRKIIVVIIAITMMISWMPVFAELAENDPNAKVPTITCDVKAGKIKAGTEISFTIRADDSIDYIKYQWDRNLDSNSEPQELYPKASGIYQNEYIFKITVDKDLARIT